MKHSTLLFCGILAAFAASWWGMVAYPQRQLSGLQPLRGTNETGAAFSHPAARSGEAAQGREVYVSLGCVACHTQQVRPPEGGSDLARGWGKRRTVARDYLLDEPVQMGTDRLGPDLTNFGERLGTNLFPMVRLYNPRLVSTNSVCPPLPFLFENRAVRVFGSSPEALTLSGTAAPDLGQQIVPTRRAYKLAAYLKSLHSSVELPEAPLPVTSEDSSK